MIATHAHLTLAVVSPVEPCAHVRHEAVPRPRRGSRVSRRVTVTARVFGGGGALLAPPLALMDFNANAYLQSELASSAVDGCGRARLQRPHMLTEASGSFIVRQPSA